MCKPHVRSRVRSLFTRECAVSAQLQISEVLLKCEAYYQFWLLLCCAMFWLLRVLKLDCSVALGADPAASRVVRNPAVQSPAVSLLLFTMHLHPFAARFLSHAMHPPHAVRPALSLVAVVCWVACLSVSDMTNATSPAVRFRSPAVLQRPGIVGVGNIAARKSIKCEGR